jgi:hypothetical protein
MEPYEEGKTRAFWYFWVFLDTVRELGFPVEFDDRRRVDIISKLLYVDRGKGIGNYAHLLY